MNATSETSQRQDFQPESVPYPRGADPDGSDEGFEYDGERVIWSPPFTMPNSLAGEDIRVSACQRPDGSIVAEGTNAPLVFWSTSSFSADKARALAKVLTDAANLADSWCGSLDVRELTDRELLEILPDLEFRHDVVRDTVKNVIHLGDTARRWIHQEIAARAMELGR